MTSLDGASAGPYPTGQQLRIAGAGYRATITEVGAGLRTLTHRGSPMVLGYAAHQAMTNYRGAVLAPWPNRIADGQYRWEDANHQLRINEPSRNCALHGWTFRQRWQVVRHEEDFVELTAEIEPQPGYEHHVALRMQYRCGEQGLVSRLTARNLRPRAAPFGAGIHPYVLAGRGRVDEWSLRLPASQFFDHDERLLPTARRQAAGTALDFRAGRQIGPAVLDHTLTSIAASPRGQVEATLTSPAGSGVRITWSERCQWVQVHTADYLPAPLTRSALVVEPMTCPPDAFRSSPETVRLPGGATTSVEWALARLM